MKKLFLSLIAVAMVLGFVSCSKDAAEAEGWSEESVWVTWEYSEADREWYVNAFYFSKDQIPSNVDENDISEISAFVIKNSAITELSKIDEYYWNNSESSYALSDSITGGVLPSIETLIENGSFDTNAFQRGRFAGYVIIKTNGQSLTEDPASRLNKYVYTFDDGSTLTTYEGEWILVR